MSAVIFSVPGGLRLKYPPGKENEDTIYTIQKHIAALVPQVGLEELPTNFLAIY